ncbi:putative regulator of Ras-like GTPase activity (Roadblock/LC7/MglB family) [Murinocardiopsis flavida]|uniref:Putative regulator of Ras-like GTPase activity (Roadblock/LC7/MglB family) n=1 Tax=Murinocardiopsis flavida TaxID=645275 RepID=A0A2P8DIW6_9ACTN|nr:roadblock/LC7 domain-containing protein [Murinocardiopsis flavida]PSK97173.1 putative regulator of Ras-like GTPase activity (Roadblock/LC7/MglB family) [Murinocardiopsis flavida]
MTDTRTSPEGLDWLLDDLVDRTAGARCAIVLSSDGLLTGRSGDLRAADAEHLSAVASALSSLAHGTGQRFGGGRVLQTVVEMEHAFLFVTGVGDGACLALVAGEEADAGLVAYEMNVLVARVGRFLDAAPRGPGAGERRGGPTR